MAGFSLRLPSELEEKLDQEAPREGVARSEVARVAIAESLPVANASGSWRLSSPSEALPLDNEALDRAEAAHRSDRGPCRRGRPRYTG